MTRDRLCSICKSRTPGLRTKLIAQPRKPTGRSSSAPGTGPEKLVRKIEEALKRIEEGNYGYCSETGEPIGVKRLEARPIATLGLEAQERHERLEKTQRGDSRGIALPYQNDPALTRVSSLPDQDASRILSIVCPCRLAT